MWSDCLGGIMGGNRGVTGYISDGNYYRGWLESHGETPGQLT